MEVTPPHLDHLRLLVPGLDISEVEHNRDGLNNDVMIVGRRRVFRFPKSQKARRALDQEARILSIVNSWVDMRTPVFDHMDDDCAAYKYIPGEPLSTDYILTQNQETQDHLAEQLATFLRQLHAIPPNVLKAGDVPVSGGARTPDHWSQMFEQIEGELYPFLWGDQKEWVVRLFEPILSGRVNMDYEPVLVHADLGAYHILTDRRNARINGVVDFGTAGLGDPASDLGMVINQLGERFVARMSKYYPGVPDLIGRARFKAGALELEWALNGIMNNERSWFMAHVGQARDVMPIESGWPS